MLCSLSMLPNAVRTEAAWIGVVDDLTRCVHLQATQVAGPFLQGMMPFQGVALLLLLLGPRLAWKLLARGRSLLKLISATFFQHFCESCCC